VVLRNRTRRSSMMVGVFFWIQLQQRKLWSAISAYFLSEVSPSSLDRKAGAGRMRVDQILSIAEIP